MEPGYCGRHHHRPHGRQDAHDGADRDAGNQGTPARLAGRYHLGKGRGPGYFCFVLPLDLAAAAQDDGTVLGLFAAQCRGQTDGDQQV